MLERIKNIVTFRLERLLLRGAHIRLLFIAGLIGLASLAAGFTARLFILPDTPLEDAVWWAFLRLSDTGYLGDDKGYGLAALSTFLTLLGAVLVIGSLVAIMTQWLNATIATLEKGLTPIGLRNHILILGWTNRTPIVIQELFRSEGRLERFLRRHDARKLRVVILAEQNIVELRQELKEFLGPEWDEDRIIFRLGTPLRLEHLHRVDFLNASAIILPASDFLVEGAEFADTRTLKTLLSISTHAHMEHGGMLPPMVAEIFDARKIPLVQEAYQGKIEIVASDGIVSLFIAQNIRHPRLSHIYTELLSHNQGNSIYIRDCPRFQDLRFEDLTPAFPRAVLLGVLRTDGGENRPILNPPAGFRARADDRFVFVAKAYADTEPSEPPAPGDRGPLTHTPEKKLSRHILLLGWNDRIPALLNEFGSYHGAHFMVDILSNYSEAKRTTLTGRYDLDLNRTQVRHMEGDYAAPSDLARVNPEEYDNIVILGCDWLPSKEEADARTLLGFQLVRRLSEGKGKRPEILVELLDPATLPLLRRECEEALVSPLLLGHILAHVALRPDLNSVFGTLFHSGGAEIYLRPAAHYGLAGKNENFRLIQETVGRRGEIALGIRVDAEASMAESGIHLNPKREQRWLLAEADEIVVLTTCE